MFQYQSEKLKALFAEVIRNNVPADSFSWLNDKVLSSPSSRQFNINFIMVPRKTGKSRIEFVPGILEKISAERPGLQINDWSIDRLARVWLLMRLSPLPKEEYFRTIENLFPAAEVNELVALYSSLPLLAHPEIWVHRCAEGVRNNIGDVLMAIMCNNPYPSENLDESAWNQLVLKAFFTEKPVEQIVGLDARANERLARTLSDYAHERWAAHRTVNPQLWRCIGPFITKEIFPDIQKITSSQNPIEQEAAALAGYHSNFEPARALVKPEFKKAIEAGELTWNKLAEKTKDYVLQ